MSLDPTGRSSRPGVLPIALVAVLFVLMPFLFWKATWFGTRLRDSDMRKYLSDTSSPHKTQHALAQLAEEIRQGNPRAKTWYPQLTFLATNREAQLRLMSAWVMGQDNTSGEFHKILLMMLNDPEPEVRWNAALALVRFGDANGEPEIRLMLRPYRLTAPHSGTIRFFAKQNDKVRNGVLVARIADPDSSRFDVSCPISGTVERRWVEDGAKVVQGDRIAELAPGEDQVWEALRALYLVGRNGDLEDVERYAHGGPGISDRARQQALLTEKAIRARSGQ